jgi:DNA-binding beta-propeller fold protein YncE
VGRALAVAPMTRRYEIRVRRPAGRLGVRTATWAQEGGRWLAAALMAIAALSGWCSTALALSQRGHVFGFSFGSAGSGAGQLLDPAGVAVDEATGDVYVVDRGNDRIDRFGPRGEFIAAWGWGVRDGTKAYEVCESSCLPGIAGAGKGELSSPEAIAIDNSTSPSDPSRGDVYVVADTSDEHGHLEKFSASGEPLASVKQEGDEAKWEGALDGVAVDSSGRVWVYRGVETEGIVERFSDAEKNEFEEPGLETDVVCPKPGLAVAAGGESVYVDHERENREGFCPAEEGEAPRPVVAAQLRSNAETLEPQLGALDPEQSSALAGEPAGGSSDVFVDNVDSVGVFDPTGRLAQQLPLPAGASGSGIAVRVEGEGSMVYIADAAGSKIDVFEPEASRRPTISGLAAQNLTPTSVRLSASIDPGGTQTGYHFEYGTQNCASGPEACTSLSPGSLPAGFGAEPVTAELQSLRPSMTYFYRLVAVNAAGEAEGRETFGSITTLPSAEGLLPDGRAWEMVSPVEKDGSGIEPLRNEGGLIQASEDGEAITYVANGPIVAEPEGNRAPYPTQALAARTSSGWISKQIVTPRVKGEGFTPGEAPEYRFFAEDLSQGLVQPDNQSGVEPLEAPPLAPHATEKTMYLRDSANGEYLPLLTPEGDTAGTRFGGQLEFVDATPDLSHVVLSSQVPLLSGAAAGLYEWHAGAPLQPVSLLPDGSPALEPLLGTEDHNARGAISADGTRVVFTGESEVVSGETTETVRHLYMRDTSTGQTLQLDAAVAPIAEPGEEEGEVAFQAANSQGTRVFFTDTARLTEDSNLAPLPGLSSPADLYECEIVEENGRLGCKLSDLTADQNPGESADVLDLLPGISEDGSYVYFVANGVLAPGASRGGCVKVNTEAVTPGATCNLYVWHEGTISFIAQLSDEDGPDWGRSEASAKGGQLPIDPVQDLSDLTARVSPSGEYLAFMSDRELTGYDNTDANPAAEGAHDEEVYLYHAASKLLVCASCNPTGAPPNGVLDTLNAGEGLGLLVDRRQDWAQDPSPIIKAPTAHWLAGSIPGWTPLGISSAAQALRQPRYLSNEGRLFFDSADPLVAVEGGHTRGETIAGEPVQVGVENVYEYEPDQVGSCGDQNGCVALLSSGTSQQESAFLEASTNGDDAFFLTAQPLVAQDQDTNFDLYDARVCTLQSPCITSQGASAQPCESTSACRAAPSPPAAPGPSGTATLIQPAATATEETHAVKQADKSKPEAGPLTAARKLAKALKACRSRWRHSARKRATCERRARIHRASKAAKHSHVPAADANRGKR